MLKERQMGGEPLMNSDANHQEDQETGVDMVDRSSADPYKPTEWREFIQHFMAKHGPDLQPYEVLPMITLLSAPYPIIKLNQDPRIQRLREHLGIPVPRVTDLKKKGSEDYMELSAWMLHLTGFSDEQQAVTLTSDSRYDIHHPMFLLRVIESTVFNEMASASASSYNHRFNRFRGNNKTLDRFQEIPDPNHLASFAIFQPDGQVRRVYLQQQDNIGVDIRDIIAQQLEESRTENLYSYDEMLQNPNLWTEYVIDMQGLSKKHNLPPYMLMPSSTLGIDIDPHEQTLRAAYHHGVSDGTPLANFQNNFNESLEEFFIGSADFEQRRVNNTITCEYVSSPECTRQEAFIHNLPEQSFFDRTIALLGAQERYKETSSHASLTFTATSGYPYNPSIDTRPARKGIRTFRAALTNRIGVGTEKAHRHRQTLDILNSIEQRLVDVYGNEVLQCLHAVDTLQLFQALPPDLIAEFEKVYQQSNRTFRQEVALARNEPSNETEHDSSFPLKITHLFHTPHMERTITQVTKKVLPKMAMRLLNGDLISQIDADARPVMMYGDEAPLRSRMKIGFSTIIPEGGNFSFTVLEKDFITTKTYVERAIAEDPDLQNRIRAAGYDTDTLTSSTSMLAWQGRDGASAREHIEQFMTIYAHKAWILKHLDRYQRMYHV
ncbi:MAG: hypothetical protein ACOCXQ_01230 [Patescibacteria group bacterium]